MNANLNWHIVFCKPNHEQKVAQLLTQVGIDNYCPLHLPHQRGLQQVKGVKKPLFSSYVFVLCSESQLATIKSIKGVINLVYWLHKPVVVPEHEINCIRSVVKNYRKIQLEKISVSSEVEHQLSDVGALYPLTSLGYRLIASEERMPVQVSPVANRWVSNDSSHQYTRKSVQTLFRNLSTVFGNKTTRVPTS